MNMMVALKVFFALLIVLFLCGQGFALPSSLSAIRVHVAKTGQFVKGHRELEVVISNNCICSQSQVVIPCRRFHMVEPLNPNVLLKEGKGGCLVNNGQPIFQGYPLKFKYVGKVPNNLTPISSQISCS